MQALFWLSIFGRLPRDAAGPVYVGFQRIIFKYIRPATRWLAISLVWMLLAVAISGLFFHVGGMWFLVPLCTSMLVLAFAGTGLLANRIWPLLFQDFQP